MKREEEIIDAGIEYTMNHHPVCIGGGAFADEMREFNRSVAFEAGAKWADSNPPKGTSLIKWQTGKPKENGEYLAVLKCISKDYVEEVYYNIIWIDRDFMEIPKERIVAWCKLDDIEAYKE